MNAKGNPFGFFFFEGTGREIFLSDKMSLEGLGKHGGGIG